MMKLYDLRKYFVQYKLEIISLGVTLLISFTPFYGIAYLVAVLFAARTLTFSKTLPTILSRVVLSALILVATIMFTGLLFWMLGMSVHPSLVFVFFILTIALFKKYNTEESSSYRLIDTSDIVSILLALIAPAIIFASYQLPNPSHAATYQFVHSGWDNASHLLMLQTATIENGYVYDNYEKVADKTISTLNAYPQAWHLSTSNIANGFGIDLFNPQKPLLALNAYAVVLLGWYAVAAYLFSRVSWSIIKRNTLKSNKTVTILVFSAASVLIQAVVYWSALTSAFANYIGLLAFITILVAMAVDYSRDKSSVALMIATIAGGAAALSWFLPLPAIGLTLLMMLFFNHQLNKGSLLSLHKEPGVAPLLLLAGIGLLTLFQVIIFVVFSGIGGGEQLNTGRLVGSFAGNQILYFIIFSFTVMAWLRYGSVQINKALIATVIPVAIFTSSLYLYQLISAGEPSYYFGKTIVIAIALTGIFFIPTFIEFAIDMTKKLKADKLVAVLIGLAALGVILIGSGYSLSSPGKLLQRKSPVSMEVSSEIVNYLMNEDPSKSELVILRHSGAGEDLNGQIVTKIQHTPFTCAHSITQRSINNDLGKKIKRLDDCANNLNEKIIVITSNETDALIRSLNNDNIETIKVP